MSAELNTIALCLWLRRAQKAAQHLTDTAEGSPNKQEIERAFSHIELFVREGAPPLWAVDIEMSAIVEGRPASCHLPREFEAIPELARFVGWPISRGGGGGLSVDHEPLDPQVLRDALVKLGGKSLPPVLYFGPYQEAGHFLHGPGGRQINRDDLKRMGFPLSNANYYGIDLSQGLDGCYCPGRIKGEKQFGKTTRPEVEGEAKLTHENGMTVLGIWDRSVDKRGACNSTYIALGTYAYETMVKLCSTVYAERWNKLADRMPISLVEKDTIK